MKRNGFTFIEILGVITLLALISVIVFVSIDGSLKRSKDTLSQVQIENIKSAASMWRTDNIDLVPSDGYYILSLSDLVSSGYIDDVVDLNSDILVDVGMNNILVGKEAYNYVSNLYGCNDSTIFCIKDRSDMEKLASEVIDGDNKAGKTYKLINNIDLGGKFDSDGSPLEGNNPWTPIGSEEKPFSGTFDGTGHIITGMYIDSTIKNTGLFSVVDRGIIQNIGIENSFVKSSNVNVASFVGILTNGGTIMNCYNKAIISGGKKSAGIAGAISWSAIRNCYNLGVVNGNNSQFTSGIVGYVSFKQSIVQNCYNAGSIISGYNVGGIVGGNQGQVINNYNLGRIFSASSVGGIVGSSYNNESKTIGNYNIGVFDGGGILGGGDTTNVTDNYFLNTSTTYGINSSSSNEGASPLTASEMPSVISVINGDGAFVPDEKGINNGYPILSWQQ